MKNLLFIAAIISIFIGTASAQQESKGSTEVVRIEAAPSKGFAYPYYLFVPKALRDPAESPKKHSFIVIPNNTGKISDDLSVHDADVKRKIPQIGAFLQELKAPVLIPVFPRPATEHRIYTHSLDRDTMITDKKEFSRFDLQLIAMIKDARGRLKTEKIETEEKVLMQGYSASGMFVNRFVFLHPRLVKAAVIGSPGGWAIAPVSEYRSQKLTFPAGVGDLKEVAGKRFDLKEVRKVPLFMILGAVDTNDAVPMGDAYDERESNLVVNIFGKTPVERWPFTETLYRENKLNATFKLYPNTAHQVSREMREDMIGFISRYALK